MILNSDEIRLVLKIFKYGFNCRKEEKLTVLKEKYASFASLIKNIYTYNQLNLNKRKKF